MLSWKFHSLIFEEIPLIYWSFTDILVFNFSSKQHFKCTSNLVFMEELC